MYGSNMSGHVPEFDIVKLTEDNLILAEKNTNENPLRTEKTAEIAKADKDSQE